MDELEYEIIHDDATIRDEVTEEVARMIEKSIEQAGIELKLKVPLAGEGKCGYNWAQVH